MCGVLVGGKSTPLCGVVALFVVFAFAVRFLDCYRWHVVDVWWSVGFAVVIVVGKRPVNRSDPGS